MGESNQKGKIIDTGAIFAKVNAHLMEAIKLLAENPVKNSPKILLKIKAAISEGSALQYKILLHLDGKKPPKTEKKPPIKEGSGNVIDDVTRQLENFSHEKAQLIQLLESSVSSAELIRSTISARLDTLPEIWDSEMDQNTKLSLLKGERELMAQLTELIPGFHAKIKPIKDKMLKIEEQLTSNNQKS